uniref:Uncharacterized protein n=1 Tax=Timema bartmani TaxID=61472 RepID=A0A7R9HZ58_9NEOP|nr:unnamed protein product [Timema bartmani]
MNILFYVDTHLSTLHGIDFLLGRLPWVDCLSQFYLLCYGPVAAMDASGEEDVIVVDSVCPAAVATKNKWN